MIRTIITVAMLAALILGGLFVFGVGQGWAGEFRQCGIASWYSYTGHRTASGRPYTGREMTAAHKSMPFGSRVRVVDQRAGRSIVVTIDDRGPFVSGRIIDLSPAARRALGMGGLARVCIDRIG